jgi:hypothetical protein
VRIITNELTLRQGKISQLFLRQLRVFEQQMQKAATI